jgi:hypothetical protein
VSTKSRRAWYISCSLSMCGISHALHPPDHTLVSMSTSWPMHSLTSSVVHFSSSPSEAVSSAEGKQKNSKQKINHVNKQMLSANTDTTRGRGSETAVETHSCVL